jgi:hypothetical protein
VCAACKTCETQEIPEEEEEEGEGEEEEAVEEAKLPPPQTRAARLCSRTQRMEDYLERLKREI